MGAGGLAVFACLSHASAKQVPFMNCPFTQATDQIKGSFPWLVRALTFELLKPVVPQEVMLP